MAQPMPLRLIESTGPSNGSHDTKRAAAGTLRKSSTRNRVSAFSTETPIQRLGGQSRRSAILRRRVDRFVRTWYVCRGVSAMTEKISRTKLRGTRAWNRSLIELTKPFSASAERRVAAARRDGGRERIRSRRCVNRHLPGTSPLPSRADAWPV